MNYEAYLDFLYYLKKEKTIKLELLLEKLYQINKNFRLVRGIKTNRIFDKNESWFDIEKIIVYKELEVIEFETIWKKEKSFGLSKTEEVLFDETIPQLKKKIVALVEKECYYLKKRF